MLGRVDDIEAAADHADRAPARLEHATVRGAVDAEREPGHHRDARVGELATELAREPGAGAGAAAGADDRHAHVGQRAEIALGEQHGRAFGIGSQRVRVARVDGSSVSMPASSWAARRARGSAAGSPPTSVQPASAPRSSSSSARRRGPTFGWPASRIAYPSVAWRRSCREGRSSGVLGRRRPAG